MRTIKEIFKDINESSEHMDDDATAGFCGELVAAMMQFVPDPDRLSEILDAEREGRCVMMPCKVGDILYEPMDEDVMHHCIVLGFAFKKDLSKKYGWRIDTNMGPIPFECIGKTVFTTRAEAEPKPSRSWPRRGRSDA